MKSREEFEALVKKKIESKQGIALQNRRAWESVAATAVACFLIFWISYLAVPHLMGNRPVGTGAQTDGDSTESEPTPTYGTETNDTTIAEDTVPIEDRVITKMHVWGHYVDGIPQTLENDFEFDVTDDAAEALWESLLGLTVEPTSLTDSELYAVASWEVEIGFGAGFEDGSSAICRLYQHYLRREYEGAESTWYRVTDPRQTYGIMESIGLSLPMPEQLDIESEEENEYFPKTYHVDTVGTASMLQTYKSYLEIPLLCREEVFDPKGLETYTVTFRYGDGISKVIQFTYEHIGFDDVWYRVDVEQYRRFTDRLGIWFREPPEQITDDEIVNAMTAVGCPVEQLPSIERELTETELTALGRYLAIRDVQNVLSCSPFARPEDIDLCGMLYATDSSALSAGERKALLSLAGSGVVENAAFSRLTTREIEALTEKYLGITFNDALRQRMLNEQSVYCGSVYYLDGYDAYYLPHNDTNLIVPELLQGWLTEDGSYLIRYREALTGDGHYICLLKPADDGYRIRMMLNLEEALADPKEPSDTTEPPETSETETDPPVDTTKPPETSKKEPVTTEPPETACRHDDGKWVTVKEPDCSNSGIAEFVCSCGEKQTKVLSATHTYRDGVCEECGEAEPVYSTGLFFVYIDARDAYAVRGIGSCKSRDLVIPPTYNDKPVIGIQTNAFYENAFITSVVLPPSIEYIGSSAFAHALSLKMITFGDGVTAIGDYAFAYTSSLKTVTLGSGVVTIGDYAFSNTKSLTTLNIRGDVSSIGSFAFYRSAITDFTIPKGLTTIMDCAFFESNISSPVIHGGITSIGKQAFAGCSNLGDVRIEEGVISIGEKAFSGACITSLSLPSTLKEIASDAFICAAQYLETISVASDNRFYSSNGGCLIELDGKTVLLGSADAIIPTDGSVTAIGDYAFYLIERRGKPLEIPHGIVRIGEAAFYYCHLEGTLLLPDSVIALGAHAFSGNLYETVIIGKGITEIPEGAFAGNSLMRELVLHSNIVSFSPTSFLNVGLEVLIIPDGITEIDGFRNNTSLKKVVFGKDVAKIADEAFLNCFSLKEVVFENVESLKSVGKDAFLGCLSLEIYPPELMPTS